MELISLEKRCRIQVWVGHCRRFRQVANRQMMTRIGAAADPLLRRTDLMVKATWKEVVLAESDQTRVVEGNHYFPPDSINWEHFSENRHTSVCPWKGVASYYDIEVGGRVNRRAAWTYREPSGAAAKIKGYVAFWNGVKVVGDGNGQESGLLDQLRSMFG